MRGLPENLRILLPLHKTSSWYPLSLMVSTSFQGSKTNKGVRANAFKGFPPPKNCREDRISDWEEATACPPEAAWKADAVSNRRFNVLFPSVSPPGHTGLPLGLTLIKLTKWSCVDSQLGPRIFPKTKVALKDNPWLVFTLEAHSVYVLEVAWLKNLRWS